MHDCLMKSAFSACIDVVLEQKVICGWHWLAYLQVTRALRNSMYVNVLSCCCHTRGVDTVSSSLRSQQDTQSEFVRDG